MANHLRIETLTGSGTWTCPAGVTSVLVECIGAGGGGATGSGGGGGGAYASSTDTVTPSTGYAYSAGTSASDTNGGDTTWRSTVVVAQGGRSRTNGGAGGAAASSTGSTKYDGGNGGAGSANRGGGGAGSSTGAGQNGGGSAGPGGTPIGAHGGIANGNTSGVPGGGGGSSASAGNAGAAGCVRLTYTISLADGYSGTVERAFGRLTTAATSLDLDATLQAMSRTAGDLILAAISVDGGATATTADSGWSEIGNASNSTNVRTVVRARTATANASDVLQWDLGASECATWELRLIRSWDSGVTPTAATGTGSGTNPNPPSVTPAGGSAKYHILSYVGWDATSGIDISAVPSGMSDMLRIPPYDDDSNQTALAVAEHHLENTTYDPGTWTATTGQHAMVTVAVTGLAENTGALLKALLLN